MSKSVIEALFLVAIAAGVMYMFGCDATTTPAGGNKDGCCPPPAPSPQPAPAPQPKPRPSPWNEDKEGHQLGAKVGGVIAPDGVTEIQIDLPGERHKQNTGGSDGSGLCVFTSIGHTADWQGVDFLEDFRDWMQKHPGGGYPSKVDAMIRRLCDERGVPIPKYIQVEGKDLDILKAACHSGRMPSTTYGVSPTGRYGGSRIAHMVNTVHADGTWYAILDNNYIGSDKYEWMSEQEYLRSYTSGGSGWSVIFLSSGPPPVPWNKR